MCFPHIYIPTKMDKWSVLVWGCVVFVGVLSPLSMCETTTETPPEYNVTIPPLIVEEAQKMILFRAEESFEMPCVATGEPQPIYSWLKDNKEFDPSGTDGRITMLPGVGTLIFARPLEKDQAIYQCLAQNPVGVALTAKIDLRQAYLEPFEPIFTREYYPQIGDQLTLTCQPPLSFPDPDIFWAYISQEERMIPIDLDDRLTLDPMGNLHMVNVMAEDYQQGRRYACIVHSTVVYSMQQGAYARVHPQGQMPMYNLPSLLWADPTHQMPLRGQTWRIKCIFAGYPTPKVDWKYIDGVMPEGRWRLESYGQELVIENVQYEDAGNYECEGINDDDSIPIRKSFILGVEAAPFWIDRPSSVDAVEGDLAVFHCDTAGIPEPVNFWFINGIPTAVLPDDPNRLVELKTMTFFNLTKLYKQVIQCNSTNKHGYVYANAYLNVVSESEYQIQQNQSPQVIAHWVISLLLVVFWFLFVQ